MNTIQSKINSVNPQSVMPTILWVLAFLAFTVAIPNRAEASKSNKCVGATGWQVIQEPMSCGVCFNRTEWRNLGRCENSYPGCTEGTHLIVIWKQMKCSRGRSFGEAFQHWYSQFGFVSCLASAPTCAKMCKKPSWACLTCVVAVTACLCEINDVWCNTCILDRIYSTRSEYGCTN